MICFAKPVLTEDLYVVQKEEFSITCYMCDVYAWRKAKDVHKMQTHALFRMLRKDYDRKGSVEKNLWSYASRSLASRRTDGR
jgi:hypothetical protein